MIIDTKVSVPPPPPYALAYSRQQPNFSSLPSHLLLHTIYLTFPQSDLPDQAKVQRQRKSLHWLALSLRLVDRNLYVASMHVLRSTYIPAYATQVRYPYSSDPFPLLSQPSPPSFPPNPPSSSDTSSFSLSLLSITPSPSPVHTLQRETAILDLFIALKVRQDVLVDESELHLERQDAYRDLFDLRQPKARLEDLVRIYGERDALISSPNNNPPSSTESRISLVSSSTDSTPTTPTSKPRLFSYYPTPPGYPSSPSLAPTPRPGPSSNNNTRKSSSFFSSLFSKPPTPAAQPRPEKPDHKRPIKPLQFHHLSISFNPRQVGLVLASPPGARKTIVSTYRKREEPLEDAAKRLVKQLRIWLEEQ